MGSVISGTMIHPRAYWSGNNESRTTIKVDQAVCLARYVGSQLIIYILYI